MPQMISSFLSYVALSLFLLLLYLYTDICIIYLFQSNHIYTSLHQNIRPSEKQIKGAFSFETLFEGIRLRLAFSHLQHIPVD